jgi:putative endonuclease
MKNTTEIGNGAERVAEEYYRRAGYALVARNFRCPRGEIDLLLFRPGELLLVEVKGRRRFDPDEAWLPRWHRKKARLREALRWFLAKDPGWDERVSAIRFEIVFVTQGRVSERYLGEPFPG